MKEIVTAPATIESVATRKDHTFKITVGTQELSPEGAAILLGLNQKLGYFAFSKRPVSPDDFLELPKEVKEFPSDKTPAQRLRACFYKLWESKGKEGDFDTYYKQQMEKLIDQIKERL